jgi:sugar-specific transcriptional regulator TrmB
VERVACLVTPADAGAEDDAPVLDARTILEDFGLTKYEIDAYLALLPLGIAEAKDICERSGVPTSKIYDAMSRLESMGLLDVQQSRPKKYMARDVSTAIQRLQQKKEQEFQAIKEKLPVLETQLAQRARTPPKESPFWSVAMGWDEFVDKHLAKAMEAEETYFAVVNHAAVEETASEEVVERASEMVEAIKENVRRQHVDFRMLVVHEEDAYEAAEDWALGLVGESVAPNMRFTTQQTQSFHVLDREGVILLIENPARPGHTLGSVFVTDQELAEEIDEDFEQLWREGRKAQVEAEA